MEKWIKNIEHGKVLSLTEQVDYLPGQIVSKTLAQSKQSSLTLFAFEKGEAISAHKSTGDAMVTSLDGLGKVIIDGEEHCLKPGESIIMPAGIPHAVQAEERFKMLLIVIFPDKN